MKHHLLFGLAALVGQYLVVSGSCAPQQAPQTLKERRDAQYMESLRRLQSSRSNSTSPAPTTSKSNSTTPSPSKAYGPTPAPVIDYDAECNMQACTAISTDGDTAAGVGAYFDSVCGNSGITSPGCGFNPANNSDQTLCRLCYINKDTWLSKNTNPAATPPGWPECPCCVARQKHLVPQTATCATPAPTPSPTWVLEHIPITPVNDREPDFAMFTLDVGTCSTVGIAAFPSNVKSSLRFMATRRFQDSSKMCSSTYSNMVGLDCPELRGYGWDMNLMDLKSATGNATYNYNVTDGCFGTYGTNATRQLELTNADLVPASPTNVDWQGGSVLCNNGTFVALLQPKGTQTYTFVYATEEASNYAAVSAKFPNANGTAFCYQTFSETINQLLSITPAVAIKSYGYPYIPTPKKQVGPTTTETIIIVVCVIGAVTICSTAFCVVRRRKMKKQKAETLAAAEAARTRKVDPKLLAQAKEAPKSGVVGGKGGAAVPATGAKGKQDLITARKEAAAAAAAAKLANAAARPAPGRGAAVTGARGPPGVVGGRGAPGVVGGVMTGGQPARGVVGGRSAPNVVGGRTGGVVGARPGYNPPRGGSASNLAAGRGAAPGRGQYNAGGYARGPANGANYARPMAGGYNAPAGARRPPPPPFA